jgi:hypothetical protein
MDDHAQAAVETRNAILEKVLTLKMQEGNASPSGSAEAQQEGEQPHFPATSLTVTVRPGNRLLLKA